MTRWKAAAIHLSISALVAGVAVALFVFLWFPPPHFAVSGGLRLLSIVVLVDVVLGPLLTLVVYRAGKPGLRFDLTAIGIVQLAALVYGLVASHDARPVYIILTPDRAALVRAAEVYEEPPPAGRYAKPPFHGIEVAALARVDGAERSQLVEEVFDGRPDIDQRPAYYLPPTAANLTEVAAGAETFEARLHADARHSACYRSWLYAHTASRTSTLRILPLVGADVEAELVVDVTSGRLIGYLPDAAELAAGCD